jgi:hypothetical protein
VNGPVYVIVPAVWNTAVMLTKVGLGLSPPSGRTKCHATAPEQSLDALTVLALPGIVVVVVAWPTTLVMVPTPAVPRPMKARPAAPTAAPAMRVTDLLCKMPARSLTGAP